MAVLRSLFPHILKMLFLLFKDVLRFEVVYLELSY